MVIRRMFGAATGRANGVRYRTTPATNNASVPTPATSLALIAIILEPVSKPVVAGFSRPEVRLKADATWVLIPSLVLHEDLRGSAVCGVHTHGGRHVGQRTAAELFERHHLALFRYVYRHTRRREIAEDVVQEVFLRVVRSLD